MARVWGSSAIAAGIGFLLAMGAGCDSMRSTRRADPAAGLDSMRTTERFPGPPEAVAEACREAMSDMGIADEAAARSGGKKKGTGQAKADIAVAQAGLVKGACALRGTTADGRPVSMDLRPSGAVTAVSVRVGRDGDVSFAHSLLERVGIRMGIKPPSPIDDPLPAPRLGRLSDPVEGCSARFDDASRPVEVDLPGFAHPLLKAHFRAKRARPPPSRSGRAAA
ncbi:MAG: hypothetical protein U0800_08355 [Isosphaeraceae bacterium]